MLAMQMSGSSGIFSVPSEHLPGLVALVVVSPLLWVTLSGLRATAQAGSARASRLLGRYDGLGFTAKAVLFGTLVGAVVHAAIIPTHWADERVTAILFIVDAAAFLIAFSWTFMSRAHWRLVSVAVTGGTAIAYAIYILCGWETMDLVGLLTTTIELATALMVVSPVLSGSPAREHRVALAAIPLAFATLLGTGAIASATTAAATSTASSPRSHGTSSSISPMSPSAVPPSTKALSLATISPAGPITWPDTTTAMAPGMKMATPDCTAQPTAAQQRAAVSLVDQTVAAVTPFKSLAAAKAAGYVPLTPTGQKIVHSINPSIYRQGAQLDPALVPVLVYVNTAHGAVLSAAMYLLPQGAGTSDLPQPGGCLTQWHVHTDLCRGEGKVVGTDKAGLCAAGSSNRVTPPMMHVWMTPVTGGPLAPDPSARSEVLGARSIPTLSPPNGTA
jgi:hypothetical protein